MKTSNLLTWSAAGVMIGLLSSCNQDPKPADQLAHETAPKSIIVRLSGDPATRDLPKVVVIGSSVDLKGADVAGVEAAFNSGRNLKVDDAGIPIDASSLTSGSAIKLDDCQGSKAVANSLQKQAASIALEKLVKTDTAKASSLSAAEGSFQALNQFFVNDFMPAAVESSSGKFVYGCGSAQIAGLASPGHEVISYPIASQVQGDKITYYVYAASQVAPSSDSSSTPPADNTVTPPASNGGTTGGTTPPAGTTPPSGTTTPAAGSSYSANHGYTQIFYAPKPLPVPPTVPTTNGNGNGHGG